MKEPMYKIEHVAITVFDLEKSVEFYEINFGFQEVKRFDKPNLKLRAVLLQLGDFPLEIIQPYSTETSMIIEEKSDLAKILHEEGINHLAFSVNDINASYDRLKENKVKLVTEIIEGRCFFCRDNDGVLIEVKRTA